MAECKLLPDFPIMSKSTLHKCCRKLDFVISRTIKKCKCINKVLLFCLQPKSETLVILRNISVSNFIKDKISAQMLSCKF